MKKYILSFSILAYSVIFSAIIINTAAAQSDVTSSDVLSNLTYPIVELGSCKDQTDCKVYCDDTANTAACLNFAENKNLMSQEDLKIAKKFISDGSKGPGSCNGKKECQTYCEDKSHIDECVSYAETNELMSTQELEKAKKVQSAIKKGVMFPSCQNKKECDAYCEDSAHMEECITFAKEAGLLSDKELENTQKVLTAVKQGVKVPACKGKDACDTYCAEASHADECVNFAIAAGIVTSDEAKIIKETGGKGPGGCKNKSECNSYCSISDNKEACIKFAEEHNIPQPEKPQKPEQNGTGPGNGAGQGKGGPGEGTGPGNGAGQGGGSGGPNQGEGFNPGSDKGGGQSQNTNPNPTKCIAECETVGKNCISKQDEIGKVCASDGQYCRQVTCGDALFDAEGNRATGEAMHACNNTQCTPNETSCFADVVSNSSICTTNKDVCVMNCQEASKPTKPTQPSQPSKPNQPTQPTKPTQPTQPTQPGQFTPPTQPTQPTMGYCGDGKCGKMEQADPTLCPQDCGGSAQQ